VALVQQFAVGARIGDGHFVRVATTRVRLVQIVGRDHDSRQLIVSYATASASGALGNLRLKIALGLGFLLERGVTFGTRAATCV